MVLTVSDWYHEQMPVLLKSFISVTNPTGAEPIPKSALFNDTQNLTTAVEPGKTYMFRIINIGAFAGQYIWFEGHTMQIVEVDGIYTNEAAADMIYVAAAQRYSVLLTTKNDTSTNFAYVASMDQVCFKDPISCLSLTVTRLYSTPFLQRSIRMSQVGSSTMTPPRYRLRLSSTPSTTSTTFSSFLQTTSLSSQTLTTRSPSPS